MNDDKPAGGSTAQALFEAAILEAFFAQELGISTEVFAKRGLHLAAPPSRETPSWGSFVLPLLLVGRKATTVVSVAPSLLAPTQSLLSGCAGRPADETIRGLLSVATEAMGGKQLSGHALYCSRSTFRPSPHGRQATLLAETDAQWEYLREDFDGPIFTARTQAGDVAAWAALKLKSAEVWEIAVETDPRFRGRGLAKMVVSAATTYILDNGRVPVYVYDDANEASGRVARALGYHEFARMAYCSVNPARPHGMW